MIKTITIDTQQSSFRVRDQLCRDYRTVSLFLHLPELDSVAALLVEEHVREGVCVRRVGDHTAHKIVSSI